jgi:hypothetical protein
MKVAWDQPNLNSGEPWSEWGIRDLRYSLEHGMTVAENGELHLPKLQGGRGESARGPASSSRRSSSADNLNRRARA